VDIPRYFVMISVLNYLKIESANGKHGPNWSISLGFTTWRSLAESIYCIVLPSLSRNEYLKTNFYCIIISHLCSPQRRLELSNGVTLARICQVSQQNSCEHMVYSCCTIIYVKYRFNSFSLLQFGAQPAWLQQKLLSILSTLRSFELLSLPKRRLAE